MKGGSEALQSNIVIAGILTQAAEAAGIPAGAIQFVDSSDRQAVTDLIKMNGLVDVVIPRGGAGLIQAVVQNATVPVIETGIGVCHTYVDAGAESPEYSAASGLNHCLGATTILSGFVFSQAPHHENVLLAIMLWRQFRISSKSK